MLCEHDAFVKKLENETFHLRNKKAYDNYKVSRIARFFGAGLITFLNVVYGKIPTYQKFKAIEVIARIPYQSWEMVSYLLLTSFYNNEKKAIELSKASDFGKIGQDNETMHVVVISQICKQEKKGNVLFHSLIPALVAYAYFIFSWLLFLINPKFSYELNYLFENHAYSQYDEFIKKNPDLKKKTFNSSYLKYYGRKAKTQYDFFLSVRNDELVHRNNSIIELECLNKGVCKTTSPFIGRKKNNEHHHQNE